MGLLIAVVYLEWLSGFVVFERGPLQIHSELCGPIEGPT
jgi:hypothetical protein